jgi:hypothetical protein
VKQYRYKNNESDSHLKVTKPSVLSNIIENNNNNNNNKNKQFYFSDIPHPHHATAKVKTLFYLTICIAVMKVQAGEKNFLTK